MVLSLLTGRCCEAEFAPFCFSQDRLLLYQFRKSNFISFCRRLGSCKIIIEFTASEVVFILVPPPVSMVYFKWLHLSRWICVYDTHQSMSCVFTGCS